MHPFCSIESMKNLRTIGNYEGTLVNHRKEIPTPFDVKQLTAAKYKVKLIGASNKIILIKKESSYSIEIRDVNATHLTCILMQHIMLHREGNR